MTSARAPGEFDLAIPIAREPAVVMDFASAWFTGHLTYTIDSAAEGSVLHQHQHERLRPRGLLRPFGRLVARTLEPRLRRRLADIKELLERDGSAGPSAVRRG